MRLVWLSDRVSKNERPVRGGIEQALAAVGFAGLLLDIAVVDQLAQHAGQALLGDLEDVEQVGDRHAGLEIDEIQHPVVGAAEILTLEQWRRRRRRSRDRRRRTAP